MGNSNIMLFGAIFFAIINIPFAVFCVLSLIFGRDKNKLKKEDWEVGYREK